MPPLRAWVIPVLDTKFTVCIEAFPCFILQGISPEAPEFSASLRPHRVQKA
jgi:hypothetical protein